MNNPLNEWMEVTGMSCKKISVCINASVASVYKWSKDDVRPKTSNALKLFKLSKGFIPLEYWGYRLTAKGKVKWLYPDGVVSK